VSVPMGAGNFQWVENEWDYLDTFTTIYICFDNDMAGQESAKKLALKLGEHKCRLVKLPLQMNVS
jgi:twinkle protein